MVWHVLNRASASRDRERSRLFPTAIARSEMRIIALKCTAHPICSGNQGADRAGIVDAIQKNGG